VAKNVVQIADITNSVKIISAALELYACMQAERRTHIRTGFFFFFFFFFFYVSSARFRSMTSPLPEFRDS
jgi:hypothetical protein